LYRKWFILGPKRLGSIEKSTNSIVDSNWSNYVLRYNHKLKRIPIITRKKALFLVSNSREEDRLFE
jgi:hypothetical protein